MHRHLRRDDVGHRGLRGVDRRGAALPPARQGALCPLVPGVGLDLCRGIGATITSTEAVVFDLLGKAGSAEFKALSKLLR